MARKVEEVMQLLPRMEMIEVVGLLTLMGIKLTPDIGDYTDEQMYDTIAAAWDHLSNNKKRNLYRLAKKAAKSEKEMKANADDKQSEH